MTDSSTISNTDDLFTVATDDAASKCARNIVYEDGVASEPYKDWFDSNCYLYSLMMQIDFSWSMSVIENPPDYIHEFTSRLYCALSSKRRISCSKIHLSANKRAGHINVRFWVSFDENVTAFLNILNVVESFRETVNEESSARQEAVYGSRVHIFHSGDYEQTLQNLSSENNWHRIKGTILKDIPLLKYDSDYKIGKEMDLIENIARELNSKNIFRVRGRWTVTWQTLHYFWLRMRKHPSRKLPNDWYEKTRDELWMNKENT